MTEPTSCPRCGREAVPGFAFCGHCGAALDEPPAPVADPAPTSDTDQPLASRVTVVLAGVLVVLVGLVLVTSLGRPADQAAGTTPPSAAAIPTLVSPAATPTPNTPASSAPPQATPTAAATPTETASRTPTPTPTPPAELGAIERVGDPVVRTWSASGFVQAQVIQELRNTGTGWADIVTGDYTIYEKDGGVAATGTYLYAYPDKVAPGGTGYLFDTAFLEGVQPSEVSHAEATVRFEPIRHPGPLLEITNVEYRDVAFGEGLEASGVVRNLTPALARSVTVGVLFLDGSGEVLGAAFTNLVSDLEPGQRKGFETVGGSPPIERSAVESVRAFASIQDF